LVDAENVTAPCECSWCVKGAGARSAWHSDDEKAGLVDGVVQITEWRPTFRTIQSMLAEYFGIDQDKLAAEKQAMLDAFTNAR
jgi:hypothetical protein